MGVRYDLRSKEILRWVMDHPGRGAPYTVRSLAQQIGRHHSLIGHLLTGERRDCDDQDAHAIAEAVGVAVLVLFAPPASPNRNGTAIAA
ncbi:hypothetical protein [Streptomyces zhihengii]|jgi:hypothetical protein